MAIAPDDAPDKDYTPERQEELRAAVRAAAAEDQSPMTAVAKETGVPYGTWSSWLGGTYAGRTDRIAGAAERWLDSRRARRRTRALAPAAPAFMMTPSAEAYFSLFEHAQHMPDLVVLSGGAGVGKTCAADAYRARVPNVWKLTGEPCFGSVRLLLDELAELLGVNEARSSQRISRAIAARLRGSGGLLIVDEAQHLSTASLDQLRTLHDTAEVGIALVGNETVYTRIEGVGRTPQFAQLFSRVGMRLGRRGPVKRDVEMLLDAWGVEGAEERRLLAAISRKPGALRGMTKALRMAAMLAAADGGRLDQAHVNMAWARLSNGGAVDATQAEARS